MPVSRQIQLFAESRVVVGPHGAAHANTLFAPRLTLIEMFPENYVNRCNLALANAAGHDYWYAMGSRSAGSDFVVATDLVEATVDAALSELT